MSVTVRKTLRCRCCRAFDLLPKPTASHTGRCFLLGADHPDCHGELGRAVLFQLVEWLTNRREEGGLLSLSPCDPTLMLQRADSSGNVGWQVTTGHAAQVTALQAGLGEVSASVRLPRLNPTLHPTLLFSPCPAVPSSDAAALCISAWAWQTALKSSS